MRTYYDHNFRDCLWRGKSQRADYHLNNLEKMLLPAVNIVGFDTKAAYVCGRIRAELEKRGTPLDLADLEIASIAIAK